MLLELPTFDHVDARTVEETVFWLSKYGERGRVVAGGTDLFGLMKDRIEGPGFKIQGVLINIKTIPDMKRIAYEDQEGLRQCARVPERTPGTRPRDRKQGARRSRRRYAGRWRRSR